MPAYVKAGRKRSGNVSIGISERIRSEFGANSERDGRRERAGNRFNRGRNGKTWVGRSGTVGKCFYRCFRANSERIPSGAGTVEWEFSLCFLAYLLGGEIKKKGNYPQIKIVKIYNESWCLFRRFILRGQERDVFRKKGFKEEVGSDMDRSGQEKTNGTILVLSWYFGGNLAVLSFADYQVFISFFRNFAVLSRYFRGTFVGVERRGRERCAPNRTRTCKK